MTLPASGTITLDDLQTEFGGSNPIQLSEYYRGGGLVPDSATNSGVPTSGTISLDDFYGAESSPDVTPDSVNWGNLFNDVTGVDNNSNQTISGITTSILLKYSISGSSITVKYSKNNGGYITLSAGSTFSVSSGDTVKWQGSTSSTSTRSGTITVQNASDSDATLDTFTYSLKVDAGGGGGGGL